MHDMSQREALDLAIYALNSFQHPDASSSEDLAWLDLHADCAASTLARMRESTAPPPERADRCAVCGGVIETVPQYAFEVDEQTGQFHRVEDLAVCISCANVMRAQAIANARAKRWTRGGN